MKQVVFVFLTAALVAAVFPSSAETYTLALGGGGQNGPKSLVLHSAQALDEPEQQQVQTLVENTLMALDRQAHDSVISQLNRGERQSLPSWLYAALATCERWHLRTEGNVSCRNGALYDYWHAYVDNKGQLERREVRKLARASRIAQVALDEALSSVQADSSVVWDLTPFADAIALKRVQEYLSDTVQLSRYQVSLNNAVVNVDEHNKPWQYQSVATGESVPQALINIASVTITPWTRAVVDGAKEQGVLDQSDGWPAAVFSAQALSADVVEASILAHLAAVKPARVSFEYVDSAEQQFLRLVDQQQRVYTSNGFTAVVGGDAKQHDILQLTVTFPRFNVADYRGPYASVWLSDKKQHLVKSLSIRGDSARWLNELRVWWRKVGRSNEALIDGFAGATRKYHPLTLTWDGLDEFGQPVKESELILHIEAAREHGGHTYQKIPLNLDGLKQQSIVVPEEGELGEITISRAQ